MKTWIIEEPTVHEFRFNAELEVDHVTHSYASDKSMAEAVSGLSQVLHKESWPNHS